MNKINVPSITRIEINFNTYEKFMKLIIKNNDLSKEYKTYLGIQIWQVDNNKLPDNVARIKYSDGTEKLLDVLQSM